MNQQRTALYGWSFSAFQFHFPVLWYLNTQLAVATSKDNPKHQTKSQECRVAPTGTYELMTARKAIHLSTPTDSREVLMVKEGFSSMKDVSFACVSCGVEKENGDTSYGTWLKAMATLLSEVSDAPATFASL